uniref:Uncharacterized protein n=1 Tax=Pristionchus pacificus TaxID=54126 RepID=A0A2A6CDX2_PRIPA|eukprot:PDM76290.1 hypothetical protein PRIPAC_39894 [Pristionchus pacificus]
MTYLQRQFLEKASASACDSVQDLRLFQFRQRTQIVDLHEGLQQEQRKRERDGKEEGRKEEGYD